MRGKEGADKAHRNTDTGDNYGEHHGIPTACCANGGSDDEGSAGSLSKGAEEVGAHAGHITHIVSDIVSNGCRVAWVILWNTMHDLPHKVSPNISSLGVNSATHPTKHGNGTSSQPISREGLTQEHPILRSGKVHPEHQCRDVQHHDTQTTEGKSHHGPGTECNIEARRPSRLLRLNGGTDVREHGHLHSEVSAEHRRQRSQHERDGREAPAGQIPIVAPADQHEDHY
mmetsp:Transcript_21123/g.42581  ORF Transcript_21123/g.42581 Transcript_21123/m.42581 type:complete len:228 (+) Transcript_21123:1453-2136(+)